MAAGGAQRRKPDWPLNWWVVNCSLSVGRFYEAEMRSFVLPHYNIVTWCGGNLYLVCIWPLKAVSFSVKPYVKPARVALSRLHQACKLPVSCRSSWPPGHTYDQTSEVMESGGSATLKVRDPSLHCTFCSLLLSLFVSTNTRLPSAFSAAT